MAKSWLRDICFLKFSLFYWPMVVPISSSLPDNLLLHLYKVVKVLASEIQPGSEQKGAGTLTIILSHQHPPSEKPKEREFTFI